MNLIYFLDLRKLDEWKTLIKDDQAQEWLESESESEEESTGSSEEDEASDNDDDDVMQTDN